VISELLELKLVDSGRPEDSGPSNVPVV
jgi:uncharacterized DUF497 family protein